MATVSSYTTEHIDAIEAAGIDSANIDAGGHLTLTRKDTSQIDAGYVTGTPPGTVVMYAGTVAPSGWILCNGQLLNRITYASLFAAIGAAYGAGDGSTTFAVPNMEAKFPRMQASALGSTGGGTGHTHTVADHTHTLAGHTHTVADHNHDLTGGSKQAKAHISLVASGAPNLFMERVTSSDIEWQATQHGDATSVGSDSTQTIYGAKVSGFTALNGNDTDSATGSTNSAGSSTDSATSVPPYLNMNFIIKT